MYNNRHSFQHATLRSSMLSLCAYGPVSHQLWVVFVSVTVMGMMHGQQT